MASVIPHLGHSRLVRSESIHLARAVSDINGSFDSASPSVINLETAVWFEFFREQPTHRQPKPSFSKYSISVFINQKARPFQAGPLDTSRKN
jgi:hypothetical protein